MRQRCQQRVSKCGVSRSDLGQWVHFLGLELLCGLGPGVIVWALSGYGE